VNSNDSGKKPLLMTSRICRESDFRSPWYEHWRLRIAKGAPELQSGEESVWGLVWEGMQGKWMHRKLWEWCAIAQALFERGMLSENRQGMGFAVGKEPLASLFAAQGVQVVASDFIDEVTPAKWGTTGQLATGLDATHWPGLVAEDVYRTRVRFMNVDMRNLRPLPHEKFHFVWSSCAFEHLGSLKAGIEFVLGAMRLVRRGGLAVHTTEYNISSNRKTVSKGDIVIYRRRDIEKMDRLLEKIGCKIESIDFNPGTDPNDLSFDYPSYYSHGRQHIKLSLLGHITSSILLIVRKFQ